MIKSATNVVAVGKEKLKLFVRLRALEAHKLLKLDTPVVAYTSDHQWQKLWLLQCEVATGGVVLELRCRVVGCLGNRTKVIGSTVLAWNTLQESPMLSIDTIFTLKEKEKGSNPLQLRLGASITPPVQASCLLKRFYLFCFSLIFNSSIPSNTKLRGRKFFTSRYREITQVLFHHCMRFRALKVGWEVIDPKIQ